MKNNKLTPLWLKQHQDSLGALSKRGRLPHAILIHGPEGTGRRFLALWAIGQALKVDEFQMDPGDLTARLLEPESVPYHPDFVLVQPEIDKDTKKEKRTISINQIRSFISFLGLTSHQSGPKTALISPAQALSLQAGNSLLKTLEEPPGDSLIVLVTDSLSRLPPTVVSRCHRIRLTTPDHTDAMNWLRGIKAELDWGPALELADGAPFGALELQRSGFAKQAAKYEEDLLALLDRRITPTAVATRWARQNEDRYLRWLYRRVSAEIRSAFSDSDTLNSRTPRNRPLQMVRKSLNIERSFACLRDIDELRRMQGAGLNGTLQLTNLLTRWYGGHGL